MKIKLFLMENENQIPNNDSEEFDEAQSKAKYLYDFISSIKGLFVEEFEIPDNIDNENLSFIIHGRAFSYWFDQNVDFYSDYYQSWAFALNFSTKTWESTVLTPSNQERKA